jgi:hypothetical protein
MSSSPSGDESDAEPVQGDEKEESDEDEGADERAERSTAVAERVHCIGPPGHPDALQLVTLEARRGVLPAHVARSDCVCRAHAALSRRHAAR